jgi:hypothetical protein
MTAMYVVGQLPGRTVILLTGGGLGMVEQSVAFARMLAPSMVVLEDVDLVAEERARGSILARTPFSSSSSIRWTD